MKYFIPIFLLLLFSCKNSELTTTKLIHLQGKTMGTYYGVQYYTKKGVNYQSQIDSILAAVNQSLSTYIPTSTISKVNQANAGTITVDNHFRNNFIAAKKVYEATKGSFNPAVMPLVNYWGFGYERLQNEQTIDSAKVEELLRLVNFDSFTLKDLQLTKSVEQAELDFSALAKGYGVDVIADFLCEQGITSFLVEIGGEVRAKGKKENEQPWVVGIRKPSGEDSHKRSVVEAVELENKSMATSGNYENYHVLKDQTVVAHTINPVTGFPQGLHKGIISSTIITKNCIMADAYATACKVMGLEKSIQFVQSRNDLKVFFIYVNKKGEIKTWTNIEA